MDSMTSAPPRPIRSGVALANTHAWPSLVGIAPAEASRHEDPFVAVDVGAGPVAVGDGAGVPALAFDGRLDQAGDRRTEAVGADDEPGVDAERAAVGTRCRSRRPGGRRGRG